MNMSEFWKNNRTLIVSILGILLILNYCARMWQPEVVISPSSTQEERILYDDGYEEEGRADRYDDPPASTLLGAFWQIIVTLSLTGVLLYYGFTRGWYARLIPKWVAFTTPLARDKVSKRVVMRITVANNTQESKTFLSPQIYFKKWQKVRKFNIKTTVFPLTLTPGTRQDLVIDIDQFWDKIPDLKGFNRVGAFIEEKTGKVYRTRARLKWFV